MAGPISIAIIGDNRKLDSALASSEGRLRRFGGVAGRVGRAAALGIAAAGAGAVIAGAKLFQLGDDANDANDRIKSVAGTLGIFGNQVDAVSGRLISYAEATARATGVDTNSIKATQAKLLTFKELAKSADAVGGNFDRATKAAIDLAATGFGTAESNAAQLGKALNDPVKGLAALTKSGVTFTDAEKERIATLVESGKVGKAQETVLKAIEGQVGGTAEAMAGGWDRLRTTATQAVTSLGQKLAPQVDRFAGFLLDRGLPAIQKLTPQIKSLAGEAADRLGPAFQRAGAFIASAAPVVLRLVGAAIQLDAQIAGKVLPVLQQVGSYLLSTFGPVFAQVGQIIVGQVVPGVQAFVSFAGAQLLPIVTRTAAVVGTNLKPIFDQLATTLQGKVLPAVTQGGNKLQQWWPTIQRVIVVVAKLVAGTLEFSSAVLGKVLPVAIRFGAFLGGTLIKNIASAISGTARGVAAVISFGRSFVDAVQDVAKFAEGVRQKVAGAIEFVRGIPGKIKGAFSNAGTLLLSIGGDIVGGLKRGIEAAAHLVTDAVNAIVDKIPKFVRDKLGISSPSKVMAAIAKWIPAGIVQGIQGGTAGVKSAMEHVADLISDAFKKRFDKKIKPERLRNIMAGFEDEAKKLRGLAKKYADVAGKLAKARELAAGVAQAARDYAKITEVGVNDDGTQTAQSITQGLSDRLAAIRDFTTKLDQLRKAGLAKETIDQIIADGVEKGSVTANAIVAGGPDAIASINNLQAQISAAGTQLGNVAAVNMYGTGQQAADGFIAGLEADAAKLDAAASRIARQLVKAIKRELGIKSPSRVARGLARQFNDGLVLQTYVDGSRIKRAGQFTAKALTDGFGRPQLTADALTYGAGSRRSVKADIHLTADTLTELELGRKVQIGLDAIGAIGG